MDNLEGLTSKGETLGASDPSGASGACQWPGCERQAGFDVCGMLLCQLHLPRVDR